jgi:hypothetical protein
MSFAMRTLYPKPIALILEFDSSLPAASDQCEREAGFSSPILLSTEKQDYTYESLRSQLLLAHNKTLLTPLKPLIRKLKKYAPYIHIYGIEKYSEHIFWTPIPQTEYESSMCFARNGGNFDIWLNVHQVRNIAAKLNLNYADVLKASALHEIGHAIAGKIAIATQQPQLFASESLVWRIAKAISPQLGTLNLSTLELIESEFTNYD